MFTKPLTRGAMPHLFERLFLISRKNNRHCHITMPLSLKTMEVLIDLGGWGGGGAVK